LESASIHLERGVGHALDGRRKGAGRGDHEKKEGKKLNRKGREKENICYVSASLCPTVR